MRSTRHHVTHHKQEMKCEWCGKSMLAHEMFSIIVAYALPGHSSHPQAGKYQQHVSHGCPGEQHFACSHPCAMLLGIACVYHLEDTHPDKLVGDNIELSLIKNIITKNIHTGTIALDPPEDDE